jgi:hypothetical protein
LVDPTTQQETLARDHDSLCFNLRVVDVILVLDVYGRAAGISMLGDWHDGYVVVLLDGDEEDVDTR